MSKPIGRPSDYSKDLAEKIILLTSGGETLTKICEAEEMPSRQTVYSWLSKHKEFLDDYAKAILVKADCYADQIIDICDETPEMTMTDDDGNTSTRLDPAGINRNRLRVDARKWVASKLFPRKYGDVHGVELTGKDGGPVDVKSEVELKGPAVESLGRIADALASADQPHGEDE